MKVLGEIMLSEDFDNVNTICSGLSVDKHYI